MICCLVNGIKKGESYPEKVRQFGLKQQYYSTAAYKSLRDFFDGNLPAIRTMQSWYSCVEGAPGISESSMRILREKAESYLVEENQKLRVSLMCDEMRIRPELCYNNHKEAFVGHTTISQRASDENDTSCIELADSALVYLVVGRDFKLPVAYELVHGLDGEQLAAITLKVIKSIEATKTGVMTLTMDGLGANIVSAQQLGVKFSEGESHFMSPGFPTKKIHIILDPPHMLKLVRRHFASNMIYHEDELIDWELLKTLVEKQSANDFNLCNKLTKKHIDWHSKPMNVRLAAETLSNSVADVLDQLRQDGYVEFGRSESTSKCIRMFDRAFDLLNCNKFSKRDLEYKQPLNEETATKIFEFASEFKRYIEALELRHKTKSDPILHSTAYTGFFGFYYNFISLKGIYEDLRNNEAQMMTEYYTFQFSQDHLETFSH